MSTSRLIIGSAVHELLALPAGSVDLIVTSSPFLAVRDYLPADHPMKSYELGMGGTPASFTSDLLDVVEACAHVLAPHGSLVWELGDSMAGSGGAGGDYYNADGQRAGQPKPPGAAKLARQMTKGRSRSGHAVPAHGMRPGVAEAIADATTGQGRARPRDTRPGREGAAAAWTPRPEQGGGEGWPLAKSHAMVPEMLRMAMAYGQQPYSDRACTQWIIRNVVRWCKPNPSVGAEGDKFRRATTDMLVATRSSDRYWDQLGARGPAREGGGATAPLYDWWEQPTGNFRGAHFATYPLALMRPLIESMAPHRVCTTCGEPSRRITAPSDEYVASRRPGDMFATLNGENDRSTGRNGAVGRGRLVAAEHVHVGWTDCGHDTWRRGMVLDPFAGSGTTLSAATGAGRDAIGIELLDTHAELAVDRIGPMFLATEHGTAHLATA